MNANSQLQKGQNYSLDSSNQQESGDQIDKIEDKQENSSGSPCSSSNRRKRKSKVLNFLKTN